MNVITPARRAENDELPRTAKRLIVAAADHRWQAWATYSHAEDVSPQAKVAGIVAVVVRARYHDRRVVAVWHNDKFLYGYIWTHGTTPTKVTARQAIDWIKGGAA